MQNPFPFRIFIQAFFHVCIILVLKGKFNFSFPYKMRTKYCLFFPVSRSTPKEALLFVYNLLCRLHSFFLL